MQIKFEVKNYRGLRRAEWSPEGVCALVGPNGAGKSTLLEIAEFFRVAATRQSVAEAAAGNRGIYGVRFFEARQDEPTTLAISIQGLRWEIELAFENIGLSPLHGERLSELETDFYYRERFLQHIRVGGQMAGVGGGVLLGRIVDNRQIIDQKKADKIDVFRSSLDRLVCFRNYSIALLQMRGSQPSADISLYPDGSNVFSVLQNWHGRREHRFRFEWVLEGLRAAFPDLCSDVDFDTGNNVVSVRYYRPGSQIPIHSQVAPHGWLAALIHLCAVASSESGAFLTIDEVENSLHPFAIRKLIEHFREWSEEHDVTICMASHSPVVIDEFNDDPDRLFVLEPGREVQPARVTELADRDWLRQFTLGRLYTHGDFGRQHEVMVAK